MSAYCRIREYVFNIRDFNRLTVRDASVIWYVNPVFVQRGIR